MKNNIKKDQGLRNIKKNFVKDIELEPNLKYEIAKDQKQIKKNNRTT